MAFEYLSIARGFEGDSSLAVLDRQSLRIGQSCSYGKRGKLLARSRTPTFGRHATGIISPSHDDPIQNPAQYLHLDITDAMYSAQYRASLDAINKLLNKLLLTLIELYSLL